MQSDSDWLFDGSDLLHMAFGTECDETSSSESPRNVTRSATNSNRFGVAEVVTEPSPSLPSDLFLNFQAPRSNCFLFHRSNQDQDIIQISKRKNSNFDCCVTRPHREFDDIIQTSTRNAMCHDDWHYDSMLGSNLSGPTGGAAYSSQQTQAHTALALKPSAEAAYIPYFCESFQLQELVLSPQSVHTESISCSSQRSQFQFISSSTAQYQDQLDLASLPLKLEQNHSPNRTLASFDDMRKQSSSQKLNDQLYPLTMTKLYTNELSTANTSILSARKIREPFPQKLYRLLQEALQNGDSDIISFTESGHAIRVHNPRKFELVIAPRYFRHCQYHSFQRQLNKYGFERVAFGADAGAYRHPSFQNGFPHLCKELRRVSKSSKAARS